MSHSLSIILPVYNVQEKLARQVEELLEVVGEMTTQVEVLIVDDGSTDHTEEVAMEICATFPQVRRIRRQLRMGALAAARDGIDETSGDLVLIHDIESPFSPAAFRQFWEMRGDDEIVFARAEGPHAGPRSAGFHRTGHGVTEWSGTQMLRRRAVNDLRRKPQPASVPAPSSPPKPVKIDRVTRADLASPMSKKGASFLYANQE